MIDHERYTKLILEDRIKIHDQLRLDYNAIRIIRSSPNLNEEIFLCWHDQPTTTTETVVYKAVQALIKYVNNFDDDTDELIQIRLHSELLKLVLAKISNQDTN